MTHLQCARGMCHLCDYIHKTGPLDRIGKATPPMKAKPASRIGLCQAAGTVSLRLAMPNAKSRPSWNGKDARETLSYDV
jgi:hypothetical protein